MLEVLLLQMQTSLAVENFGWIGELQRKSVEEYSYLASATSTSRSNSLVELLVVVVLVVTATVGVEADCK